MDRDEQTSRTMINHEVYPEIQFRLVAIALVSMLGSLVILGGFTLYQSIRLSNLASQVGQHQKIMNDLYFYGGIFGVLFVIFAGLIVVVTLVIAHRIVGPLTRLEDELETMVDNQAVHLLRTRNSDYLQRFFETLNRVLVNLIWKQDSQSD